MVSISLHLYLEEVSLTVHVKYNNYKLLTYSSSVTVPIIFHVGFYKVIICHLNGPTLYDKRDVNDGAHALKQIYKMLQDVCGAYTLNSTVLL